MIHTGFRILGCLALAIWAGRGFAAGPVDAGACLRGLPPAKDTQQLIVSAAPGEAMQLRQVLKSAGLDCIAQLQIDGACLVQYRPRDLESPESVATRLKTNILALQGGQASPETQSVVADVVVNAGSGGLNARKKTRSTTGGTGEKFADPKWVEQKELKWLGAEQAWFDAKPATALTAIVDTGVVTNHRDLDTQFHGGVTMNCRTGRCDGTPRTDWTINYFHGTQVAGIIGARRGNGFGGVGVAHNGRFLSINFGPVFMDFPVACALQYARAAGARVINGSWGGDGKYLKHVANEVVAAEKEGILFVLAAGDISEDIDDYPDYPASLKTANLLTVMGYDVDARAPDPGSNVGKQTVHIAAPNRSGWTTELCQGSGKNCEGPTEQDGTSWAAAHVSGAAALLESRYPGAGYDFLKWRILENATPDAQLQGKSQTGGVLNLARTLYPVTAAGHAISRVRDTAIDWRTGIREDMCATVGIEGRKVAGNIPGAWFELVASTDNDGSAMLPYQRIPAGNETHLQVRVQCIGAKPAAETSPLPLR